MQPLPDKQSHRKALTLDERELKFLREHTFAPPALLALPIKASRAYRLYLTQEETEELAGYVAAEANHARGKRLESKFDELYEKLSHFGKSFSNDTTA